MSDRIEQLLRDADASCSDIAEKSDLADRVLLKIRSRDRIKRIAGLGAVAAVCLICVGVMLQRRPGAGFSQTPHRAPAPPTHTSYAIELQKIETEIADRSQLVDRAISAQRLSAARLKLAKLQSLIDAQDPTNRAALTIVTQADRLARSTRDKHAAVDAYREVIHLFPQSPAADLARHRIATIPNEG